MLGVSIVVPVLNAARTLPECLAALDRLDPQPLEIILVDNGSTDGSLQLLRQFSRERTVGSTYMIEERQRGPSAARNAGVRIAKGEVIAFTDADCAPKPDWLHHLTKPFADSAVGATAGGIVPAPTTSTVELVSALYTLRSPDRPVYRKQWSPWEGGYPTANLAVRRALLEKLGGFDESMMTAEDQDLCARLYAQGLILAFTPDASVSHYHRSTVGGLVRQAFGFGRGHADLLRRHTSGGLWLSLPRRPVTWGTCPVRAWVDLASADKKVLAILGLGAWHSPLFLLLPIYGFWLAGHVNRRAKDLAVPVSLTATLSLVGLLVLKSAAMTLGRWRGSLRYGVLCF